jgi:hypothetical protein
VFKTGIESTQDPRDQHGANRQAVGPSHKNLAKIDLDGLEGPVSIIPYFDGNHCLPAKAGSHSTKHNLNFSSKVNYLQNNDTTSGPTA